MMPKHYYLITSKKPFIKNTEQKYSSSSLDEKQNWKQKFLLCIECVPVNWNKGFGMVEGDCFNRKLWETRAGKKHCLKAE